MIVKYQYKFISSNKGPTLMGDVAEREGYACVEAGRVWESSVPYFQFTVNLNIFYKIKSLKKAMSVHSPTKCYTIGSKVQEIHFARMPKP